MKLSTVQTLLIYKTWQRVCKRHFFDLVWRKAYRALIIISVKEIRDCNHNFIMPIIVNIPYSWGTQNMAVNFYPIWFMKMRGCKISFFPPSIFSSSPSDRYLIVPMCCITTTRKFDPKSDQNVKECKGILSLSYIFMIFRCLGTYVMQWT